MTMLLTQGAFERATDCPRSIAGNAFPGLWMAMQEGGIVTYERICMFLAQCGHESDGFTRVRESLYYTTPAALVRAYRVRIPTEEFALQYLRAPEKLANYVYGNRKDLGNTEPGDGWRFIGRGYIQLTGRDNYARLARETNMDCITDPLVLERPLGAARAAVAYWGWRDLNAAVDRGDSLEEITRRINGGTNGIEDRRRRWALAMMTLEG